MTLPLPSDPTSGSLVLHMDEAKYRAHPAIARSDLDKIMVSPAHFKRSLGQSSEPSDAMKWGTLVHAAVLEPKRFWPTVAVFDGKVKRGKAWDAFVARAVANGRTIHISQREETDLLWLSERVEKMGILTGHSEVSIFWRDERFGIDRKARLDHLAAGWVYDLKTTSKPLEDFIQSIEEYGYDRQGEWYWDAAESAGETIQGMRFIVVETTGLKRVGLVSLTPEQLARGREQNEANLTLYTACLSSGHWPEAEIPAAKFWRPEMDLVRVEPNQPAPSPNILDLSPDQRVMFGAKIATSLADVIEKQKLFNTISGRKYVKVEGWLTLGSMLGVFSREKRVTELPDGSYEAVIELFNPRINAVMGEASAICGVDEKRWKTADKYARRSMAITRATGKAYRMTFSWIMSMAGYAETPEEEMPERMRETGSSPAPAAPVLYNPGDDAHKGVMATTARTLGVEPVTTDDWLRLSNALVARSATLTELPSLIPSVWAEIKETK
jgi:hypothetical protein